MNRATVNKIFQKHPVYVKAGMIAVISIIIFGCVYSKDNGKKLEKDGMDLILMWNGVPALSVGVGNKLD